MTPIAEEIYRRWMYLADPKVKWIPGVPHEGEVCLAYDGSRIHSSNPFSGNPKKALTLQTKWFLDVFTSYYVEGDLNRFFSCTVFNDHARNREEVLWMLEEAYEEALELEL